MNKIFEMMVDRVGGRESLHANSKMSKLIRCHGVSRSSEFKRIEALPRRKWDEAEDLAELVELLTEELKTPSGSMELWPQQAAALREIHDLKGTFLPLDVGDGKALISLLAPVVLDARQPVLFVPAALREQTKLKVIPQMRRHWKLCRRLRIIGYSELSLAKNIDMLERLKPDLVILDEVHSVARPSAARTKRLKRYMSANPQTMVVAMSGTASNRSLKDYAHIVRWCLKDTLSPLPITWGDLSDWADALDARIKPEQRVAPGALLRFCKDGENARQGFRRRLIETPGVIASTGEEHVGASLIIRKNESFRMPSQVLDLIHRVRELWEDPNGDPIMEAVDLWRKVRQLALGFWFKWDPPAPPDWMDARRAWGVYVRETLKHNRRKLDTELQIWNECERNNGPVEWRDWKAIRATFKPNPVPQWLSDQAIDYCLQWSKANNGIIWVENPAFGERLAEKSGLTYFGAGKNASREILDAPGPFIASIIAHGQGKNLQHHSQNLVASPPASGKTWQQLLGRTHRAGQEADEVIFDVLLHAEELRDSFQRALDDARYLEDTLSGRQKLNYATIIGG